MFGCLFKEHKKVHLNVFLFLKKQVFNSSYMLPQHSKCSLKDGSKTSTGF